MAYPVSSVHMACACVVANAAAVTSERPRAAVGELNKLWLIQTVTLRLQVTPVTDALAVRHCNYTSEAVYSVRICATAQGCPVTGQVPCSTTCG